MSKQRSTKAAQAIVDDAQSLLSLDLVADLAEPLARSMLARYVDDEWRHSRDLEALIRVAALFDARGREVPSPVLDALDKANRAGRATGWRRPSGSTALDAGRSGSGAEAARATPRKP